MTAAAARKKREKPTPPAPPPVSTDSTYCILYAGIRCVQVVADGKGIRQGLSDEPVAVYPGYVGVQTTLDFDGH